MRLRNIPGAIEIIRNHPNYIENPEKLKGKWAEHFANENPLHIEIGSGKGKFITTLANQNQHINYIGIEKFAAVLVKLIKKILEERFINLAILHTNAENILQLFEPGEIKKIFLNFSDPWQKNRYAKQRLTNVRFLEMFKRILSDDGVIALKTDNLDLFNYSIKQFELAGFLVDDITYDLHNSPLAQYNVTTEYEEKFASLNMQVYALSAYKSGRNA